MLIMESCLNLQLYRKENIYSKIPLNPQSHSKYASSVTSLSEQRRGSIHQSGLPESSINQQALRDTILGKSKL